MGQVKADLEQFAVRKAHQNRVNLLSLRGQVLQGAASGAVELECWETGLIGANADSLSSHGLINLHLVLFNLFNVVNCCASRQVGEDLRCHRLLRWTINLGLFLMIELSEDLAILYDLVLVKSFCLRQLEKRSERDPSKDSERRLSISGLVLEAENVQRVERRVVQGHVDQVYNA